MECCSGSTTIDHRQVRLFFHAFLVEEDCDHANTESEFSGQWSATVIPGFDQASIGKRGRIAIGKDNNLYLALPDSSSQSLRVLKATSSSGYKTFVQGYEFQGCDAEPLIDKARLEEDDDLSILTTRNSETGENGIERDVVVIDLELW